MIVAKQLNTNHKIHHTTVLIKKRGANYLNPGNSTLKTKELFA